MKTNYHTHTKWCKHATGTIEEVVCTAIKQGFDEIGISPHVPYENIYSSRMDFEELEKYFEELKKVEKKYGRCIKILRAFECEYFKDKHDYYLWLKNKYNIDYFILGQHFPKLNSEYDYFSINNDLRVKEYEKYLLRGMRSGLFKIVAHPDMYMARYTFTTQAYNTAKKIFEEAERLNIALEINANGFRNNLNYPCSEFWDFAKNYNVEYIVNSDSHAVKYLDDNFVEKAYNFAKEKQINIIEKINFN